MHTHWIRKERDEYFCAETNSKRAKERRRVRKRSETRIMMKLYSTETETNFTQFIFLIFHNIFGLILSLRKSVMWLHTDATCHMPHRRDERFVHKQIATEKFGEKHQNEWEFRQWCIYCSVCDATCVHQLRRLCINKKYEISSAATKKNNHRLFGSE